MLTQTKNAEQKLGQIYRQLDTEAKRSLLDFAEFLAQRVQADSLKQGVQTPSPAPRPAQESVIAAIKRLSRSYAMLERSCLFDKTSELMMQHTLQGRAASDVIDDLEAYFAKNYQDYLAKMMEYTP